VRNSEPLLSLATNLFPLWVLLGCVLALVHPPLFTWFRGDAIVWGLAAIMLGMGITLSVDDFRRVLAQPARIFLGFAAQYTVMPIAGYAIARAFDLEPAFAVGVILVGCAPGGTASNVVTYLAKADVALSVLMTMCSTMGAIVMTPLLTAWLAGTLVPVDAWGLFLSTVQVVLLPVLLGVVLHHTSPRLVAAVLPVAPLVSVIVIALICASIIGQSADAIRTSGLRLLGAVMLVHGLGFATGYALPRLLRFERVVARTVSIEVGMQNSGLAVVLARKHFADPLTAVPGAISSVVHSVVGSALAAWWRMRPPEGRPRDTRDARASLTPAAPPSRRRSG
jgi:BASS family bile acid:Na+ symporter